MKNNNFDEFESAPLKSIDQLNKNLEVVGTSVFVFKSNKQNAPDETIL